MHLWIWICVSVVRLCDSVCVLFCSQQKGRQARTVTGEHYVCLLSNTLYLGSLSITKWVWYGKERKRVLVACEKTNSTAETSVGYTFGFSLKFVRLLELNWHSQSCFALLLILTFFSFPYSLLCLTGCASVVFPVSFYLPLLCHHLFLSLCLSIPFLSVLPLCPPSSLHLSSFFVTSATSSLIFFHFFSISHFPLLSLFLTCLFNNYWWIPLLVRCLLASVLYLLYLIFFLLSSLSSIHTL